MEKLLTEVCAIQYGFPFDSSKFSENEGVPLIRIRDVVRGFSETYTTEEYKEEYLVHEGDLLIGMDGEFNIAKWGKVPSLLNQRVCRLIPLENIDKGYLFYFMPTALKRIEDKTPFVTVKHLSAKELNKVKVPLPSLEEQRKIAAVLDKVSDLIVKRRQQLKKLDFLVKARFVEMFGDPVSNPLDWEKVALSDLADVSIGPFGSLLHKEDYILGGHPLVNPSHIIDGKICPDDKLTISDNKYNELEPYHLKVNDVVMGRRGEMGRCAVVYDSGLLCGTGSLIIRTKGFITADFLQKILSFPSFKKTIEDMAVGQTMPNLNVSIVANFQIIKPPLKIQNEYYNFIEKIETAKSTINESLTKLETLKKALMQEYFEVM
ncbi:restriction endonuclease subunit S [Anaerotignum lactatifermentans]|uniref:restriction endonuclease subunit S n=1 Tax=Anaerotignum lactatifermentans TaxID=160404 RepID=UPI0024B1C1BD|nr:restriction endonuclease subunit S [Anaerotignum lactatifermentans]